MAAHDLRIAIRAAGRTPHFHERIPVYVEAAGDRAETGPYLEAGLVNCGTQH
jgi:hypothetical protein